MSYISSIESLSKEEGVDFCSSTGIGFSVGAKASIFGASGAREIAKKRRVIAYTVLSRLIKANK